MADILDTIRDWLTGTEGEPSAQPTPKAGDNLNRDKQTIVSIVEDLNKKHSAGIVISEIVEKAKEQKISEFTTRQIVDQLVRDRYLERPDWMHDMVRMHGNTDYSPWSEDFPV